MNDLAEILAERDFLAARFLRTPWWVHDHGISSDAMLREALGGAPVDPQLEYPSDHDDLGRCERLYATAPAHLRPRMLPLLEDFRRRVGETYPLSADWPAPATGGTR